MSKIAKEFITNIVIGGKINPSLQKAFSVASNLASKASNTMSKFGSKASKATENVNNKINGLSNGFSNLHQKIAAIGATIGAIKIGKTMLDQAANMEQYRQTLNVIMKDTKKAEGMMKWAVGFANVTPFETEEVVAATVKLQSYGIEAKKTLPLIGDMAGVMGKDIDQAVEAVADAQQGMLERLKQFGIKKEQIVEQANKKLKGIEVVNSKGQITNQKAFNLALFSLMKERYQGGMELQSKSFKGMMSTIGGIVRNGLATIAGVTATGDIIKGSIFDIIKIKATKVMETLLKFADNGTFEKIGTIAGEYLGKVVKIIDKVGTITGKVFSNIGNKFTPLFNALSKGQSMSHAFYVGFKNIFGSDLAATISDIVGYVEFGLKGIVALFKGNTSKAGDMFYAMFPDESETGKKVVVLIKHFKMIGNAIKSNISNIINIGSRIGKAIGDIFVKVKPYIENFIIDIISLSNKIMPIISSIISFIAVKIIPAITNTLAVIVPKIVNIMQSIWNVIRPILSMILSYISFILPFIEGAIMTSINSITQVIRGIITVIDGVISFISGVFTGNWANVWQGVVYIFKGIFGTIAGIAKAPLNAVIGLVNGAISNLNKISIDIPDWVPLMGGKHFGVNIPQIPMLAKGGIATMPSICGEAGPESVIPIKRNNPRSIYLLNKTASLLGLEPNNSPVIKPLRAKEPRNILNFNKEHITKKTPDIKIIYSPTIQSSNSSEIKEILDLDFERFKVWFSKIKNDEMRLKYE